MCNWLNPPADSPFSGLVGCVVDCASIPLDSCNGTEGCRRYLVNAGTGERVCEPDCGRFTTQAGCESDLSCKWDRFEQDTVFFECNRNCVYDQSLRDWVCIDVYGE